MQEEKKKIHKWNARVKGALDEMGITCPGSSQQNQIQVGSEESIPANRHVPKSLHMNWADQTDPSESSLLYQISNGPTKQIPANPLFSTKFRKVPIYSKLTFPSYFISILKPAGLSTFLDSGTSPPPFFLYSKLFSSFSHLWKTNKVTKGNRQDSLFTLHDDSKREEKPICFSLHETKKQLSNSQTYTPLCLTLAQDLKTISESSNRGLDTFDFHPKTCSSEKKKKKT